MNQEYVDTVRLLLAITPAVFKSSRFAMKGGRIVVAPSTIHQAGCDPGAAVRREAARTASSS
jgi:hypothetical protein